MGFVVILRFFVNKQRRSRFSYILLSHFSVPQSFQPTFSLKARFVMLVTKTKSYIATHLDFPKQRVEIFLSIDAKTNLKTKPCETNCQDIQLGNLSWQKTKRVVDSRRRRNGNKFSRKSYVILVTSKTYILVNHRSRDRQF